MSFPRIHTSSFQSREKAVFWLGIGVSLFLLLGRVPQHLYAPSLFLEDGAVYYKYGFEHGFWEALLRPHLGYYSFWPNFVTLMAAQAAPMEYAPHVVFLGALAMWLLPALLICLPGSPFRSAWGKALALWLLVLTPPLYGRFMVNCAHFFAGAAAFLILLSAAKSRKELWLHRWLLVFCGLNGAVTAFLTPLAFATLWRERTRERFIQLEILSLCMFLQLLALVASRSDPMLQHGPYELNARFQEMGRMDIFTFWMFCRSLLHPLLGEGILLQLGQFFEGLVQTGGYIYEMALFACFVTLGVWGFLIYGAGQKQKENRDGWKWLAGFLSVSLFSFMTGLPEPQTASKTSLLYLCHRYFIVPNLLMYWAFVVHTERCADGGVKWLYRLLLAWMLLAGVWMWRYQTPELFISRPNWQQQVARWKQDPYYRLAIMPGNYRLQLSPRQ